MRLHSAVYFFPDRNAGSARSGGATLSSLWRHSVTRSADGTAGLAAVRCLMERENAS
jgi:hypothetical protein